MFDLGHVQGRGRRKIKAHRIGIEKKSRLVQQIFTQPFEKE